MSNPSLPSEAENLAAIGLRFQRYFLFKGWTKAEASQKVGFDVGYINRTMEGINFQSDFLQAILLHCPDLNPQWLIAGSGEMLLVGSYKTLPPIQAMQKDISARLQEHAADTPKGIKAKANRATELMQLLAEAMDLFQLVQARYVDAREVQLKQFLTANP
ncbi:MAG: hypothetical protein AAFQ98_20950 [Bacteroidota bacterium]